ncbi:MAG: hypothetical protein Greene07147_506 [Parcubacteria group bacterium Greene0714_7]|nr:MAG: hypothetical protein Greene07147_506 [Parcubacteria group bacterium Greene0714_7]
MEQPKKENPPLEITFYAVEIAKLIREIGKEGVIKKLQEMVKETVEKFDVR